MSMRRSFTIFISKFNPQFELKFHSIFLNFLKIYPILNYNLICCVPDEEIPLAVGGVMDPGASKFAPILRVKLRALEDAVPYHFVHGLRHPPK